MKSLLKGAIFSVILSAPVSASAQTPAPTGLTPELIGASYLKDNNGDGVVTIAAFGDSITKGEGDFQAASSFIEDAQLPNRPEAGYPLRIESYLNVPVFNWGDPGESLLVTGEDRFIRSILRQPHDVVIIAEGSNDARAAVSSGPIYRSLQKLINVAHVLGITPVLSTIIPACCGHSFLQGPIDTYNPQIRLLAAVNEVPLADPDHAFRNTCAVRNCRLLSRPEGLHPNIEGYDVMGEAMISALLNINIFAPDGPALYAQALGIPVTSVRTVPDPLPVTETPGVPVAATPTPTPAP